MNPLEFPLLADENIHAEVISGMRVWGLDMLSVTDVDLTGQSDSAILQFASRQHRVVLTHDSDFGRLVFLEQMVFPGIIYLRPGHIDPVFTLHTLDYLRQQELDVAYPFVIVAERSRQIVRLRVRQF